MNLGIKKYKDFIVELGVSEEEATKESQSACIRVCRAWKIDNLNHEHILNEKTNLSDMYTIEELAIGIQEYKDKGPLKFPEDF